MVFLYYSLLIFMVRTWLSGERTDSTFYFMNATRKALDIPISKYQSIKTVSWRHWGRRLTRLEALKSPKLSVGTGGFQTLSVPKRLLKLVFVESWPILIRIFFLIDNLVEFRRVKLNKDINCLIWKQLFQPAWDWKRKFKRNVAGDLIVHCYFVKDEIRLEPVI